jgi:hypothetical protein
MNILYSPIIADFKYHYAFDVDKITVLQDGTNNTDTFDFSTMPNGQAGEIVTDMPYNPIIHAERIEGVLSVVLLNPITETATEAEKFPEWTVV